MGERHGEGRSGALVVVRASQIDFGQRPVSPSWQSPDIYQPGGVPIGEVVVGVPVQLVALVSNFGAIPAYGVQVTFWAADSGLGISKAAANPPIGRSEIKTVAAGAAVEFACDVPWTPAAVSSGAHPCLVVEAAGSNCPVVNSFRPDIDTQVAQRNLTIKAAGASQFKLKVFNPFAEAATASIYAMSLRIAGARVRDLPVATLLEAGGTAMRRVLREQDVLVEDVETRAHLRLVDVERLDERPRDTGDATSGALRGAPFDTRQAQHLADLDLRAGGTGVIVLEGASGRGAGDEVFVHQLVQVTRGFQIGGYSLLER